MFNLTNPACVEYLAKRIRKYWERDCGHFDGMYFDRVQGAVSFMWNEGIDLDRDGVARPDYEVDEAWRAGVKSLLAAVREFAPNALICGYDAIYQYAPWMHGRLFEMHLTYINDAEMPFDAFLPEYQGWDDVHRAPWPLPLAANQAPVPFLLRYGTAPWGSCPSDSVEWVRTSWSRMRFGLASALTGNGLYTYDFGTTWWGHRWWYDEYDFDLGKPIGDAVNLSPGMELLQNREDFEDGTPRIFYKPGWCQIAELRLEPEGRQQRPILRVERVRPLRYGLRAIRPGYGLYDQVEVPRRRRAQPRWNILRAPAHVEGRGVPRPVRLLVDSRARRGGLCDGLPPHGLSDRL